MATPIIDTEDAAQLEAARALVAQFVSEAHATETALVTTLQAHIAMTPEGSYRRLLETHLEETRAHAAALQRRLGEIGGGPGVVTAAVGLVQTVVGQVLALGKAPIDVLRGASGQEKLLKNAKDECAAEALEIATYEALEAAAEAVGDDSTADLARRHRADEERMLSALRAEIPQLTRATVRERVGGDVLYDVASTGAADAVRDVAQRAADAAGAVGGGDEPGQEEPPIPGYDQLNAGQVIRRLPTLSAARRRAVADYERRHRNRSTVLARIDALEMRPPAAPRRRRSSPGASGGPAAP